LSKTSLQDTKSIIQVLGCLMLKPDLLNDLNEYDLNNEDFPEQFHKIIFAAINNLYQNGAEVIDEPTIDGFLAPYDVQYKIFNDNKGVEVLTKAKDIAQLDNFDYHYWRVKKFSFLRSCQDKGIDVSDIYSSSNLNFKEDADMKEKFDKYSLDDLSGLIEAKVVALKDEFKTNKQSHGIQAAKGMKENVKKLEQSPDFGAPLCSKLLNTICRGARLGKYFIRSLPTGGGKTRLAVADLLNICCNEIYDPHKKRWESNGIAGSGLFITTELDEEEIQTIMIAYLTNIEESKILEGSTTDEEKERINYAIDLIERSNIWIEYLPDFNIDDIKRVIESYIIKHNVQYVAFDYIHTSVQLMSEISSKSKMSGLREDQMLLLLSNALKNMATSSNVWLLSATQVNASYKEKNNQDESALRGAKSIADKADCGMLMRPVTKEDDKLIESVLHSNNFMGVDKPNYVCTVYKNRRGKYSHVDVWLKVNLGTNRTKDCFVTKNDELIDVPLTDLVKTEFDF
jgi:replicative DNA helicase